MIIRKVDQREIMLSQVRSQRSRKLLSVMLDLDAGGEGVLLSRKDWETAGKRACVSIHTYKARLQKAFPSLRSALFRTKDVDEGVLFWRVV
jgi:hypothetical protein